jgi:hypothetical protein
VTGRLGLRRGARARALQESLREENRRLSEQLTAANEQVAGPAAATLPPPPPPPPTRASGVAQAAAVLTEFEETLGQLARMDATAQEKRTAAAACRAELEETRQARTAPAPRHTYPREPCGG